MPIDACLDVKFTAATMRIPIAEPNVPNDYHEGL